MNKYLKLGNHVFNKSKIAKVVGRKAFLYISNPYIMEIEYQKHWIDMGYVNFSNTGGIGFSLPITESHSHMNFKIKYETMNKIETDLKIIDCNCPHAKITHDFCTDCHDCCTCGLISKN